MESAILGLLDRRAADASICPSEVARAVAGDGDWRALMEPVREAARRLTRDGTVEITRGGEVVEPGTGKGPVRIRRGRR
ncbi:DUF3253 domain-containing protein [Nakamurella endophytica]|uniref:DUF3253 domain-containing protein n=1 Tax=Nakamurella endophytica TaxID=1748367 RepID=UPI003570C5D8